MSSFHTVAEDSTSLRNGINNATQLHFSHAHSQSAKLGRGGGGTLQPHHILQQQQPNNNKNNNAVSLVGAGAGRAGVIPFSAIPATAPVLPHQRIVVTMDDIRDWLSLAAIETKQRAAQAAHDAAVRSQRLREAEIQAMTTTMTTAVARGAATANVRGGAPHTNASLLPSMVNVTMEQGGISNNTNNDNASAASTRVFDLRPRGRHAAPHVTTVGGTVATAAAATGGAMPAGTGAVVGVQRPAPPAVPPPPRSSSSSVGGVRTGDNTTTAPPPPQRPPPAASSHLPPASAATSALAQNTAAPAAPSSRPNPPTSSATAHQNNTQDAHPAAAAAPPAQPSRSSMTSSWVVPTPRQIRAPPLPQYHQNHHQHQDAAYDRHRSNRGHYDDYDHPQFHHRGESLYHPSELSFMQHEHEHQHQHQQTSSTPEGFYDRLHDNRSRHHDDDGDDDSGAGAGDFAGHTSSSSAAYAVPSSQAASYATLLPLRIHVSQPTPPQVSHPYMPHPYTTVTAPTAHYASAAAPAATFSATAAALYAHPQSVSAVAPAATFSRASLGEARTEGAALGDDNDGGNFWRRLAATAASSSYYQHHPRPSALNTTSTTTTVTSPVGHRMLETRARSFYH